MLCYFYYVYCDEHQRPPGVRAIRRDLYVGESAGEAAATGDRVVAAGYRGFAPEATIVGDAAAVANAFADLAQIGFTHVIVRNLVADQAQALASIARFVDVKKQMGLGA